MTPGASTVASFPWTTPLVLARPWLAAAGIRPGPTPYSTPKRAPITNLADQMYADRGSRRTMSRRCGVAMARARARAIPARGRARAPAAGLPCAARRARQTTPLRRRRRRPDARQSRLRRPACRVCGPAPGRAGAQEAARARRRPARTPRRAPRATRGWCSRPRCARRRAPDAGRRSACRRRGGCRRSGRHAGAC